MKTELKLTHKYCCRCKLNLTVDNFYPDRRNKSGLASECNSCHYIISRVWSIQNREKTRAYGRKFYHKHKNNPSYRARHKLNGTRAKTQILRAALKNVPCFICGEKFPPEAMDFDHINPTSKSFKMAQISSRKILLEEAKKCRILCANCHRVHSHNQRRNLI